MQRRGHAVAHCTELLDAIGAGLPPRCGDLVCRAGLEPMDCSENGRVWGDHRRSRRNRRRDLLVAGTDHNVALSHVLDRQRGMPRAGDLQSVSSRGREERGVAKRCPKALKKCGANGSEVGIQHSCAGPHAASPHRSHAVTAVTAAAAATAATALAVPRYRARVSTPLDLRLLRTTTSRSARLRTER